MLKQVQHIGPRCSPHFRDFIYRVALGNAFHEHCLDPEGAISVPPLSAPHVNFEKSAKHLSYLDIPTEIP